jgi:hypothetical protein
VLVLSHIANCTRLLQWRIIVGALLGARARGLRPVIHNVKEREREREREKKRERERERTRERERERERRERERERASGHNACWTDGRWMAAKLFSLRVTGENTHGADGGGRTNEGALKEKSRRNAANGGTDGMTRHEWGKATGREMRGRERTEGRKTEKERESEGERRHSRERVVKSDSGCRARFVFSNDNATTGCCFDRFFLELHAILARFLRLTSADFQSRISNSPNPESRVSNLESRVRHENPSSLSYYRPTVARLGRTASPAASDSDFSYGRGNARVRARTCLLRARRHRRRLLRFYVTISPGCATNRSRGW